MQSFALALILAVAAVSALPQASVKFHGNPFQDPCEPTPDPNVLPPGNLNVSLHAVLAINEGSTHQGAVLTGHSSIVADVEIIIITLRANFDVLIPDLLVEVTTADVTGYLDFRPMTSLPAGNITGSSNGMAHIQNLRVVGGANLFVNIIGNKVSIRDLDLNAITFDAITLDFGSITIGGQTYDWPAYSAGLKAAFDAEFANSAIKNPTVEKIRLAANTIVGKFTLAELIDLIGGGGDECPEPTGASVL